MILRQWAVEFGVPWHAVIELERRLGLAGIQAHDVAGRTGSESRQQSLVRLEAGNKDVLLWRNNVGALTDARGVPIRYGLANESKKENERIKSADLIGIRKRIIHQWMCPPQGLLIGQFVSREIKEESWHYSGTPHEVAQLTWNNLIVAYGGDACFATGPGTL